MNPIDIFKFLIPGTELLPIVFFVVIWGLFFFTIFRVRKATTPENWKKNWDGDTKDVLDAEHGSVMEISDAVATSAEKMADIMPGMILIIGLLGTFLSLGLALDKASLILTHADVNSMNSSMSNLTDMLQGLGTKFKTSTWGLLAFIGLKLAMSKNGYEERRLRWSIRKVNEELKKVRELKVTEDNEKNAKIIESIGSLTTSFKDTLLGNQVVNCEQRKELIEQLKEVLRSNHSESIKYIQYSAQQNLETRKAMEHFVKANVTTVETLGQSASSMSKAAKEMGDSVLNLKEVVNDFRVNMGEVVTMLKNELGQSITGMNNSFNKNMEKMSCDLGDATQGISKAVNSLSVNVNKTMNGVSQTIQTSMDNQQKAQELFISTTKGLNKSVGETKGLVEMLKDELKKDLQAVAESNRNVIDLTSKLKTSDGKFDSLIESIKPLGNMPYGVDQLIKSANEQEIILTTIADNTSKNITNKPRSFGISNLLGDNSNER